MEVVSMSQFAEKAMQEVLNRLDAVAKKLGVAATEVWRFTVKAKMVEAYRDLVSNVVLLLVPVILFAWVGHVSHMQIPHDTQFHQESTTYMSSGYFTCSSGGSCTTTAPVPVKQPAYTEDKGISNVGWAYVVSAIICAVAALIFLFRFLTNIVSSAAAIQTAEYRAFTDIIDQLRN